MKRMIHTYHELFQLVESGRSISIDFDGDRVSKVAEKHGWQLGPNKQHAFLNQCLKHWANFEVAYTSWGADFWVKD
ncbi:MAG: hypothetical protein AAFR39_01815 [Pseudomonadota bacterium]